MTVARTWTKLNDSMHDHQIVGFFFFGNLLKTPYNSDNLHSPWNCAESICRRDNFTYKMVLNDSLGNKKK